MLAERKSRVNNARTKLSPTWNGPFRIVKELGPLVYQVCLIGYDPDAEDLPRGVLQEAHLERIAMFSSSDVWTPVDVDELERSAQHDARQYQVKGVTQWRRQNANNKRLEFRVRWRGFEDPKDDSWEPEEEVQLEPVLLSAAIELCERRQAKSADCAACLKRLRKHQGKKADASVEDVLGEVEYQPPVQKK
jgi:hypothetical protein